MDAEFFCLLIRDIGLLLYLCDWCLPQEVIQTLSLDQGTDSCILAYTPIVLQVFGQQLN